MAGVPEELLSGAKNYLDMTWPDAEADRKLEGILLRGMAYLDHRAGMALDYGDEGTARALLLDYARYAQAGALQDFGADFAAELLAEEVDADVLLILTEVEKAAIRFGKPDQEDLGHISLARAAQNAAEGQFGVGSMLPKVEAAMRFVRANPGKRAIITSLDKALDALDGKTGTAVTFA